ncbi:MAG: hypothetical protein ABI716_03440, partial [Candidatus Saccharibacteria bacterium]
ITETSFVPVQSSPDTTTGLTQNLPVELSYAQLANLMAWPVAILAALFIILNRRAKGCVSVGTALLLPGLLFVAASSFILSRPPDVSALSASSGADMNSLLAAIANTAIPSLAIIAQFIGILASAVGIIFITAGYIWRRETRHRAKLAEQLKSSHADTPLPTQIEALSADGPSPTITKIPITTYDDTPNKPQA